MIENRLRMPRKKHKSGGVIVICEAGKIGKTQRSQIRHDGDLKLRF